MLLQEKTKASEKDKSLFFDRIADSFVALFTTVNPEVKDKVLAVSIADWYLIILPFNPFNPQDASKHYFAYIKNDLIS